HRNLQSTLQCTPPVKYDHINPKYPRVFHLRNFPFSSFAQTESLSTVAPTPEKVPIHLPNLPVAAVV
ncbi:hypothetical protein ACHAXS_009577, partial [Conticribra weissflogii]